MLYSIVIKTKNTWSGRGLNGWTNVLCNVFRFWSNQFSPLVYWIPSKLKSNSPYTLSLGLLILWDGIYYRQIKWLINLLNKKNTNIHQCFGENNVVMRVPCVKSGAWIQMVINLELQLKYVYTGKKWTEHSPILLCLNCYIKYTTVKY